MKNNFDNIRRVREKRILKKKDSISNSICFFSFKYYFGTTSDQEQAIYENPIDEIVTKMVASKHF